MTAPSLWRIAILRGGHNRTDFSCGIAALDRYLRTQAGQDQRRGVGQIYVATPADSDDVAGYYSVSTFGIDPAGLPSSLSKKLPRYDQIPAAIIGRLAVDQRHQGHGLGKFLLFDALYRLMQTREQLGLWAVVVDAKDKTAAEFYARYGFASFPSRPLRLFLPMETVRRLFSSDETGGR